MTIIWRGIAATATVLLLALLMAAWTQLPGIGAGGLLHPGRTVTRRPAPAGCREETLQGADVRLKAWRCRAAGPARGTIVYLHGIADNRSSAEGVIGRFLPRGFDVIAYDSRAHGDSTGEACTYGFFEKQDLRRIIETAGPGPIVLIGTSLGGAVALQAAAEDPRVSAVVAAETFSDLRTVASERAPWFFSRGRIDRAFELAEQLAHFQVDAVSPEKAAARLKIPVLLIHGAADVETPPAHSERVYGALKGPKRLVLVPGAGHNGSLKPEVWKQIEAWIDEVLPASHLAPPA
jgi:pimeloyl-ACP methyl ester carboxylesterase